MFEHQASFGHGLGIIIRKSKRTNVGWDREYLWWEVWNDNKVIVEIEDHLSLVE